MPPHAQVIDTVAELFRVLAHPSRVRILALLHERECDVSELTTQLGIPPANASQHLALLRAHHLVVVRRAGTHVFYSLRDPRMAEVINRALDILAEDVSHAGEMRRAIARARLRAN
jgi:DNA-binding transcriptional ArsR family regulator